jgi:hypothetical protein
MDISELPFFVGILLVLVVFFAAFVAGTYKAKRLGTQLRWPVRVGASAGAAVTVLLIALFVLVDYWWTGRAPAVYSPDGKHVAVLTWRALSAIDDGIATVKVRHSYSPFAKQVYSGPGYDANSADVQLRWIDNSHLLIRYGVWLGNQQACGPHVSSVEVTCEEIEPSVQGAIQMVGPRAICDGAAEKLGEAHTSKVEVVITVSPNGAVETLETVFPSGLQLEKVKEAADAIRTIRFEPAIGGPLVRVNTVIFDCSRP